MRTAKFTACIDDAWRVIHLKSTYAYSVAGMALLQACNIPLQSTQDVLVIRLITVSGLRNGSLKQCAKGSNP